MNEFGLKITSPEEQKAFLEHQKRLTIEQDGTTNVLTGGYYGTYLDLEGANTLSESDLILKYRELANQVEVDKAIQNIIEEAIVVKEDGKSVEINLDEIKGTPDRIKKLIIEEFDRVLKLLNFRQKGAEIFRNWYIDGRTYFQFIFDERKLSNGVVALEWIDPRKIKKMRVIQKNKDLKTNIEIINKIEEFFIYNEAGVTTNTPVGVNSATYGIRIASDSIVYVPSGLLNAKRTQVISYLHKAMKPTNQLKMVEDAMVINRLARAPERRLFYIDTGTMSTQKANQYVRNLQQNFRNKLVYDAETGEIRDDRKFMSVLEDFWLPRREGGKGTEISTLPGASNLGDIEDVNYLRNKLYNSLNIPVSRLVSEAGFNLGRTTEITRDEVSFSHFIKKLRQQFTILFNEILERSLILKGIVTSTSWEKIKEDIWYDFQQDNNFEELKNTEILRDRLDVLNIIDPHVGKYFSRAWVKKNVLHQDEQEIEEIQKEMDEEIDEFGDPALEGEGTPGMPGMPALTSGSPAPATSAAGLTNVNAPPPQQEINVKIKNPTMPQQQQ